MANGLNNWNTLESWIIMLPRNMFFVNFQQNTLLLQTNTIKKFWAGKKISRIFLILHFGHYFVLWIQMCILCLNMCYIHLPFVVCVGLNWVCVGLYQVCVESVLSLCWVCVGLCWVCAGFVKSLVVCVKSVSSRDHKSILPQNMSINYPKNQRHLEDNKAYRN